MKTLTLNSTIIFQLWLVIHSFYCFKYTCIPSMVQVQMLFGMKLINTNLLNDMHKKKKFGKLLLWNQIMSF